MTEQPIPTTERLARALEAAGAPQDMINQARKGYYDDFKSDHATPIILLARDTKAIGLNDIAKRAMNGEFDATKEESDAWAESPEGEAAFRLLMIGEAAPSRPKNPSSSRKKRRR